MNQGQNDSLQRTRECGRTGGNPREHQRAPHVASHGAVSLSCAQLTCSEWSHSLGQGGLPEEDKAGVLLGNIKNHIQKLGESCCTWLSAPAPCSALRGCGGHGASEQNRCHLRCQRATSHRHRELRTCKAGVMCRPLLLQFVIFHYGRKPFSRLEHSKMVGSATNLQELLLEERQCSFVHKATSRPAPRDAGLCSRAAGATGRSSRLWQVAMLPGEQGWKQF